MLISANHKINPDLDGLREEFSLSLEKQKIIIKYDIFTINVYLDLLLFKSILLIDITKSVNTKKAKKKKTEADFSN